MKVYLPSGHHFNVENEEHASVYYAYCREFGMPALIELLKSENNYHETIPTLL